MSKIKYEIFDTDAEVIEFADGKSDALEISFTEKTEGLISLSGSVTRLTDGRCTVDTGRLAVGTHTPILVKENGVIKLPSLVKSERSLTLSSYGDGNIRDLSIRERRLSSRVDMLEKRLSELEKKLDTTTIF